MTEAWATWTASLPRASSRSERTAMTSLYSMRSPVSVQLRGPFLFELPQLRLVRLQLHAGAVPDLFVMDPCARGLHPHPPFGVLDRAPQALAFLRELLQFQADAMVPLLFGQQLARPRLRDAREGRVESRHPGICTPPPAEDEEGRRESDQATRDVRSHDVAEACRLVHAKGIQEERPEHGDRDREDDAQGEAVQPVVLAVQLPFSRMKGVDEEVSRQEEQEHAGPDHTRRRGGGGEASVRQRPAPPAPGKSNMLPGGG